MKENQRVKNNKATTDDCKHLLNDLLDNLEKVCERSYNLELKNGIPTPATLRQYLVDFINQNEKDIDKPTLYGLIARFISGEIKFKGREKSKRLESARDLFIFDCFVGLRYSDYSTVKPENIVEVEGELYIKLITQKTKDLVIIPCNPIVRNIFDKYAENANKLPRAISNQKFNEAIKEACELAGFKEIGRLSTDPGKELYSCISSHTARRSFATNLYLEGFPVIDLMKITGHRTERASKGFFLTSFKLT